MQLALALTACAGAPPPTSPTPADPSAATFGPNVLFMTVSSLLRSGLPPVMLGQLLTAVPM